MPDGSSAALHGLAANASTVVATGSIDVDGLPQAAAWTSSDGGVTFEISDVTAAHAAPGTSLETVVAVPSGYAALACTATPAASANVLMTSPDGRAWQRVEIVATSGDGAVDPNTVPDCSSLQADGDRLLLGALFGTATATVRCIGLDGRGEWLTAPQGSGRMPVAAPLAARRTDGEIGVVGRETRGFSAGLADVGSSPSGTGLPVGRPETNSIGVMTLDGRVLAYATRYPLVRVSGSTTLFTRHPVWATDVAGTWEQAGSDAVPEDAAFAVDGGSTDVAFGLAEDPADEGRDGPAFGTGAWVRTDAAPWTPVGLVASGPGGDHIARAVAVPGGFIAVGTATTVDDAGARTSRPIVTTSADGTAWTVESPPGATEGTTLDELCPLPDGSVLALGTRSSGDERVPLVLHRAATGVWSEVGNSSYDADGEPIAACAVVAATTVIITMADSVPTAYRTSDGSAFTASPIDHASMFFTSAVTASDLLYAAGSFVEDDGNVNGMLWRTTDGDTWTRVPVDGLAGVGDQFVIDIAVSRSGALIMAGFDRDLPVTWTVTPP